jgi:hypothetical protein
VLEVEILPGYLPEPRVRRRGGWVAGVSALTVAGVIGGGVYAWSALNSPGDQPERHLPATTVAMLKIDLNPPAGQKVQALRFAAKLPSAGSSGDGGGDLRQALYEELSRRTDLGWPSWSDVSPWLGERAAVALIPGTPGNPIPVAVLQVTDQQRATKTLRGKLTGGSGAVVGDGWAYLSDSEAHAADALAQARKRALDADVTFTADAARLGGDGIVGAWFDGSRLARTARDLPGELAAGPDSGPAGLFGGALGVPGLFDGHGSCQLRFTGADLELVGSVQGTAPSLPPRAGTGVERLPGDSVVAVGVNDAGKLAADQWQAMQRELKSVTVDPTAGARLDPGATSDLTTKQIAARLKKAGISAKTAQRLATRIKAAEGKGGVPVDVTLDLVDGLHSQGTPAAEIVTQLNDILTAPSVAIGGTDGPTPSDGFTLQGLGGLNLPGDLEALLGTGFTLAAGTPAAGGSPVVGVRVTSSSPRVGPATTAVSKLLAQQGVQLQRRDVPGGVRAGHHRRSGGRPGAWRHPRPG